MEINVFRLLQIALRLSVQLNNSSDLQQRIVLLIICSEENRVQSDNLSNMHDPSEGTNA